MRILMVAVEAGPYASAGGTGAVVGTLSRMLRRRGHDVRLVLPYYSTLIRPPAFPVESLSTLDVPVGRPPLPEVLAGLPEPLRAYLREVHEPPPRAFLYRVLPRSTPDEVPTYLIGGDPYHYFARVDGRQVPLYPPLEEIGVNAGRLYAFYARAVLEAVLLFAREGWTPDVIHCHDWPTALIPACLRAVPAPPPLLEGARVVLTIHNTSGIVYQGGWFGPEILTYAGLPRGLFDYGQVQHQGHLNFMKAGILFADAVNTVSEGYAREIQSDAEEAFLDLNGVRKTYRYSGGLDYVWSQYQIGLTGIRNGIGEDYDPRQIGQGPDWDLVESDWTTQYAPAEGRPLSEWAYSPDDPHLWKKKSALKRYLQERSNRLLQAHFQVEETVPLIAVRSRLVEQKGFDLIIRGLREWPGRPAQFLIVAWGEDEHARQYRQHLEDLAHEQPQRIALSRSWREIPEPLHYAGADMLLMPSLFEPCGLPHMMALRYGTIPIVRRTGGLADVVEDADPLAGRGNGFDFVAPDHREMLQAVERALRVYQSPPHWQALVRNALRARDRYGRDFSWETAVTLYLETVYR